MRKDGGPQGRSPKGRFLPKGSAPPTTPQLDRDTGFFRWLFGVMIAVAIICALALFAFYKSAPTYRTATYSCYGPLALEAIRGNYKPC